MQQVYFLQVWFSLADKALEDAILDSVTFRPFLSVDLGYDQLLGAITLLCFFWLPKDNGLMPKIFETVNHYLRAHGLYVEQVTVVDTSILFAPSPTKNIAK